MRLATAVILSLLLPPAYAQLAKTDITGPAGSERFGQQVHILANGNFVVIDPNFDASGPVTDVGAVYLYSPSGNLISTLTGTQAGDQIGNGVFGDGVFELDNSHFVVVSALWDNGAVADAGAVTWVNGFTGLSGSVSPANSLVGTQTGDKVGLTSNIVEPAVVLLSNGHYLVRSVNWDNGGISNAGAVTWSHAMGTTVGPVTAGNSLVGSSIDDQVGAPNVVALSDGHYVVGSRFWDSGSTQNVGAVTWGNGSVGISGAISAGNSMTGLTAIDGVGSQVYALNNGHYAVVAPFFDAGAVADAGAIRWCPAGGGCTGVLTAANALIGGNPNDRIGNFGARVLANGHFVVRSPNWNGDLGAATWVSGTQPTVGSISAANSLVGAVAGDQASSACLTELTNGHYVVCSSQWDNGAAADVGAVTWGNGSSGTIGVVGASNSLIGTTASDFVGSGVGCGAIALSNGHYAVCSPRWDNAGTGDVGAVTWAIGTGPTSDTVSAANSLIGSTLNDEVGTSAFALTNGHYVVASPRWDNAGAADRGAVTWRNGNAASFGVVGTGNSLVGPVSNSRAGIGTSFALPDGRYVASSPRYDGLGVLRGAVTPLSGSAATSANIGSANSLVGGKNNDQLDEDGRDRSQPFLFGHYLIVSPEVDSPTSSVTNVGAVSVGKPDNSTVGTISATNSLIGEDVTGGGNDFSVHQNGIGMQAVVGQPRITNKITLLRSGIVTSSTILSAGPDPSGDNQPVTVDVLVSANPAPTQGSVRIVASSGEAACIDSTPTVTSATTSTFTCAVTLQANGARNLRAEFLGSDTHAYSVSANEPHNVVVDAVFKNGFETALP